MINIKNTLDYIVNKTDNIIIVYYILSTMKAEEVLNLLQISRKTLHVYARDGRIQYTVMPNRMYNYNEEDVKKNSNLCTGIHRQAEERFTEPDRTDEAVMLHEWKHDQCNIFPYGIRNII